MRELIAIIEQIPFMDAATLSDTGMMLLYISKGNFEALTSIAKAKHMPDAAQQAREHLEALRGFIDEKLAEL